MKGQMPGADKAIKLSQALEVTVEFLFGGENASGANPLVGFDEAEWVMAPRYRLADFAGGSKPDPVETIPIRKDWLSQAVRIKKNLWVTDLPSTTEGVGFEGDAILCRDAETHFQEGWYLYFYDGMPIVRRVIAPLPGQPLNDLAGSDAKLRLVARVLGTIKLRPI